MFGSRKISRTTRAMKWSISMWVVAASASASAAVPTTRIQDMTLELPDTWSVVQQALDEGTGLFVLKSEGVTASMYVKAGNPPDARTFLVNGSTVVAEPTRISFNGHAWTVMQTKKTARSGATVPAQFVFGFFGKFEGNAYYGYTRGITEELARSKAIEFLSNLH